jgi:hypothetical protein
MTIRSILRPFEIFYGQLVYFVVIWYISPRFGFWYQEKSGNPGLTEKENFKTKQKNEKIFFQCARTAKKQDKPPPPPKKTEATTTYIHMRELEIRS